LREFLGEDKIEELEIWMAAEDFAFFFTTVATLLFTAWECVMKTADYLSGSYIHF
jgi:hypothetical protein